MASALIGKQAVVIGAGMGGLTAAGALADHFDRVIVLEREHPALGAHLSRGDAAGAARACAAAQRPARPQRVVPGVRAGSRAGREPCAQGRSRCALGAPGLRSLPATRSRLVQLRRVTAGHRATPCDGGWKAAPTSRCASAAGYRKCWRRQMERRSPACATRTTTARARRLRRISSSTPPDAAPSRSPCCNRSAARCRRRPPSAIDSAMHMHLCHSGRRPPIGKASMTSDQAPHGSSRGGLLLPPSTLDGDHWRRTVTCRPAMRGFLTYARRCGRPTISSGSGRPIDCSRASVRVPRPEASTTRSARNRLARAVVVLVAHAGDRLSIWRRQHFLYPAALAQLMLARLSTRRRTACSMAGRDTA